MTGRFAPLALCVLCLTATPACGGEPESTPKSGEVGKATPKTQAEAGAAEEAEAGNDAAVAADAGAADAADAGLVDPPGGDEGTDEDTDAEPLEPLPDSFDEVGVAICDQYVSDYVTCIDEKVPEAEREAQRRIVFDNVRAWRQTKAGSEAAAKGLQTGCRIAREQAKRATSAWACDW